MDLCSKRSLYFIKISTSKIVPLGLAPEGIRINSYQYLQVSWSICFQRKKLWSLGIKFVCLLKMYRDNHLIVEILVLTVEYLLPSILFGHCASYVISLEIWSWNIWFWDLDLRKISQPWLLDLFRSLSLVIISFYSNVIQINVICSLMAQSYTDFLISNRNIVGLCDTIFAPSYSRNHFGMFVWILDSLSCNYFSLLWFLKCNLITMTMEYLLFEIIYIITVRWSTWISWMWSHIFLHSFPALSIIQRFEAVVVPSLFLTLKEK